MALTSCWVPSWWKSWAKWPSRSPAACLGGGWARTPTTRVHADRRDPLFPLTCCPVVSPHCLERGCESGLVAELPEGISSRVSPLDIHHLPRHFPVSLSAPFSVFSPSFSLLSWEHGSFLAACPPVNQIL